MSKRVLVKDKYVHAMEYLHRHPDRIFAAWWSALHSPHVPGACLFAFAGPQHSPYGCLTQIRRNRTRRAATDALTSAIRDDERLPKESMDIHPEHLNVFAEWQRRLDRELGEDR